MPVESASFIKDLNSSYPEHENPKAEGDNHIRLIKSVLQSCFPNLGGQIFRKSDKATDYTVLAADITVLFNCTAALTLTLTAAASLGDSHLFSVYANGGDVTINPNGAELINGASTLTVRNGAYVLVYCTGTSFFAITLKEASIEAIKVNGLYLTLDSTNPASVLGYGTWEAFGTGKALVGVDGSNTLMDAAGDTFGSADSVAVTHGHTINDPGHVHVNNSQLYQGTNSGSGNGVAGVQIGGNITILNAKTGITIASSGESGANKNYQPSIAVYIWKRTA